jgi:hypothetical protein
LAAGLGQFALSLQQRAVNNAWPAPTASPCAARTSATRPESSGEMITSTASTVPEAEMAPLPPASDRPR